MSTLTSASTDAQVFASYDNNASYEEDSSREKALAFVTACRFILRRVPKEFLIGGTTRKIDPGVIRSEMTVAREWIDANPSFTEGLTTFVDLRYNRE